MALTVTTHAEASIGNVRMKIFAVTFDSSYPTGGESFTNPLGGLVPLFVVVQNDNRAAKVVWDYTNKKLVALHPLDNANEYANTSDLSNLKVRVLVIGI